MHQFSISIWPAAQMSEFWLHVSEVEVLENGEEIGSFNLKLTSAKIYCSRKPQFAQSKK